MSRTAKAIIWTLIFVALLLATDQFLLRVEFSQPQMQVARSFYLDFRQRLITLGGGDSEPGSVEAVIETDSTETTPGVVMRRNETDGPRYLYLDPDGNIQFADSLDEIPRELRGQAERLSE